MATAEGHDIYRPRLGRAIAVATGAVCAIALVALVADGGGRALVDFGAWPAVVAVAAWALFWRPEVDVSDSGVRLVNVMRTIELPWPSITAVEMRWALEIHSAYGTFTAWAAPARSRGASRRSALLPRGTYRTPAASTAVWRVERASNPASAAAEMIASRWEELRRAGHLDDPRLEHDWAPIRWHIGTLATGGLLLALGVVSVIV